MNADRTLTIKKIRDLVDEYGNGAHPLPTLIELRRELAVYLFRLSAHVKDAFGKKGYQNAFRKYAFYREIATAIEKDKAALGKARAMNQYEVETEAMDSVLQAKKVEVEAEAEWEEVRVTIDLAKQILAAMQQEVADARHEKGHTHFLDQAQQQDTLKGLGA